MWHPLSRAVLLALGLSAPSGLLAQDPKPEAPAAKTEAPAAKTQAPAPKAKPKGKTRKAPPADDAQVKPEIAAKTKARSKELKAEKAKAKATPPQEQVDINRASKEELMKLPGMTEAYAAKVIAGRPYKTKVHLVTHDVLPYALYTSLKARIAAKQ